MPSLELATEDHTKGRFARLQLFTATKSGWAFYETLGYSIVEGIEKVRHAKVLG